VVDCERARADLVIPDSLAVMANIGKRGPKKNPAMNLQKKAVSKLQRGMGKLLLIVSVQENRLPLWAGPSLMGFLKFLR
jgi:hypothetical protein